MSAKEHIIFWATKLAYIGTFFVLPILMKGVLATILGYLIVSVVTGWTIGVVFQLAHVVESTDFHDAPVEGEKSFQRNGQFTKSEQQLILEQKAKF